MSLHFENYRLRLSYKQFLEKVGAVVERFKTSIQNLRPRIPVFLIIASVMTYGVVFSYFTILRHDSFYSAGWDLGNFNQAFFTTLRHGRLFYYTADLFFSPSGSLFAIHTSPILFLLVPIYAVNPSPATLLVVKSFSVGLAAIPLYLIAKESIGNRKGALALVLVYLLYSPLHGANWFDFQQSAFLPLLLFSTYFFMIKKEWKLYFPSMLLTLMVEEHVALIVAIVAVYYFTIKSGLKPLSVSIRRLRMDESTVPIVTIVVCAIYLLAAILIKNTFPVNPDFAEIYKATGNFKVLGSSDVLSLPVYVLLHPQQAIDALIYDYAFKFFYLVLLLGPLLFIPLRNRFCFGILFLLMPFLLSNYRPYYLVGVHYPFYILPLLFIATIYGLSRLQQNARIFSLRTMIAVTMLFTISTSPLSPFARVFITEGLVSYSPIEFSLDENKRSLNDLLELIPSNASVLTHNLIFPHVSDRANAYAIPFDEYGNPDEMHEYISYLLNSSEYVLLDVELPDEMVKKVLYEITRNKSHGPYALAEQAILFRRGYNGEPINAHYIGNRTFEAYQDLSTSSPPGSVIDDSSSSSGKVLFYPKNSSGIFVFGPYIYLLQGSYEVTFTARVGQQVTGYLATFDAVGDLGTDILSFRDAYGFEFKAGEWTNITVSFNLQRLRTQMEFRVISAGAADMYVDRVFLRRLSSVPIADFGMKTVRVRDLKLKNGIVTHEGFLVHQRGTVTDVFWYGPYWSLSPGNFRATFAVRIFPPPVDADKSVLTLSVSGRTGVASEPLVLKDQVLYAHDFTEPSDFTDWRFFALEFTIESQLIDVELRGLVPSPDYDIYLAFITLEKLA